MSVYLLSVIPSARHFSRHSDSARPLLSFRQGGDYVIPGNRVYAASPKDLKVRVIKNIM